METFKTRPQRQQNEERSVRDMSPLNPQAKVLRAAPVAGTIGTRSLIRHPRGDRYSRKTTQRFDYIVSQDALDQNRWKYEFDPAIDIDADDLDLVFRNNRIISDHIPATTLTEATTKSQ